MKSSRFMPVLAVMALIALQLGFTPKVNAAQTDAEITSLLTTGQWIFTGKGWGNMRTFKADGTFHGRKDGTWKIADGKIRLIFVDHEDDLILPLDPKGTKGIDANGNPMTAVQQIPAPPVALQTEAEINALFTSGTWHFQGKGWANDRVFLPDKTFTGGGSGTWKMGGGVVIVITNSKEMKLNLPLDPKGTTGIGSTGAPVFIYRLGETPVPTPPPGMEEEAPVIAAHPTPAASQPAASSAPADPRLMALLVEGQWYFQGMNWSNIRVFKQDGTFTTQRHEAQGGTWKIQGSAVVLTFKSFEEKIFLPLDAKGGKGVDEEAKRMIVMRQPLVEPTPAPVPPAEISPAMLEAAKASKQTAEEIKAMLVGGQWYFQGKSWANTRVFNSDGTFKGGGDGFWKIADGKVILSSHDREESFILPVDPKGTNGIDSKGNPMIALQQPIKPLPPKMGGVDTVNHSGQSDKMITDLLTLGQWYFQGRSWANTRVFRPDGTFYTLHRPGEGGTWKIIEGMVVLSLKENENLLMLPIDTQLTIGQDPEGIPILVFWQPLSEPIPTPTPKPEVIAKNNPAKTPAPAAGGNSTPKTTPAWFGTTKPDGPANVPAQTPPPAAPPAKTPAPPVAKSSTPTPTPAYFGTTRPDGSPDVPAKSATPGVAPASTGIPPELQQKAYDLIKTYHNSLVFITGKDASGSGFIATSGTANYLFTTALAVAGINDAAFKTLDDTVVQGGTPSIAVGHDIFRMEMPAGGKPLEVMQGVDENAVIGDYVVVLGNAEGSGVINPIIGKIVGIGADRLEVDAPFIDSNSGSPIIHINSGKVIGVATNTVIRKYDVTTKEKIEKPVIRRFGYRIDNVKTWQTVNWRAFYAQAAEMKSIEALTGDLYDFFRDLVENKGKVTKGRHQNPAMKNIIDQWMEERSHRLSASDAKTANVNFLSYLKVACQSDVTAARQHMTYDYFQRALGDEQRERDEMSKAFEEIINNLGD